MSGLPKIIETVTQTEEKAWRCLLAVHLPNGGGDISSVSQQQVKQHAKAAAYKNMADVLLDKLTEKLLG